MTIEDKIKTEMLQMLKSAKEMDLPEMWKHYENMIKANRGLSRDVPGLSEFNIAIVSTTSTREYEKHKILYEKAQSAYEKVTGEKPSGFE